MARPPTIALVVDNPSRDLPGLVLVAARLAAGGATCHLVPMLRQDVELRSLDIDSVLLNYLRPGNQELARSLVAAGVAVVVLDTEGGVLESLDDYEQLLAKDGALRHLVAYYLSWGHVLAAAAPARGWFGEHQVAITGSPRFDYYHPSLRLGATPPRTVRPPGSPLVLFNASFPVANPRFQTPAEEARTLVDRFGYQRETVSAWQETQNQALRSLAALAAEVAQRHPEAHVVVRPHPFERSETYRLLLPRLSNLELASEGTVDRWIIPASAVVQRSCTTAIEACLAGVPALSPRFIPILPEMESAEAVSIGCSTPEELHEHLDAALVGSLVIPEAQQLALERVVHDWLGFSDGRAHERVAARLLDASEQASGGSRAGMRGVGLRPEHGTTLHLRLRRRSSVLAKTWLPPQVLKHLTRAAGASRATKEFTITDVERILEAIDSAGLEIPARATETRYQRLLPFGRSVTIQPT